MSIENINLRQPRGVEIAGRQRVTWVVAAARPSIGAATQSGVKGARIQAMIQAVRGQPRAPVSEGDPADRPLPRCKVAARTHFCKSQRDAAPDLIIGSRKLTTVWEFGRDFDE